jgi:hypothetical protein
VAEEPRLLSDDEVARLLRYPYTMAFRRHRKALEAVGFPTRRPVVKRYSRAEVCAWIDGTAGQSDEPAPVASGWSESPGGACTHWKAPPCHGAHPLPTFRATPEGGDFL